MESDVTDKRTRLQHLSLLPDERLPLAQTLILIGAIERDVDDIRPYEKLVQDMHDALTVYIGAHAKEANLYDSVFQAEALRQVIHEQFGFKACEDGYEDPEQINFLRVLDKRGGIPVGLGALYLELAFKQGWNCAGMAFPGHFLLRFEQGAQRMIVDPFKGDAPLQPLQASDLRALLKQIASADAELHHDYFDAVTRRDVVLRFCNNRKTRLIKIEDYAAAMVLIELEMTIAPNETRLLFDAGMVVARLQQIQRAIDYLERYIANTDDREGQKIARQTILNLQRLMQ